MSIIEIFYHQTQTMYGVGSDLDRATQAITGALSAIAMGNSFGAAANLTQPYIANQIGQYFDDPQNTNEAARALSHAALGAAVAYLSGNDATSGAAGAVTGEVIAQLAIKELYGDKDPNELTLEEKENIRAVATLASGLVGAASGGNFEDSATAAAAGYNAAVNNKLKVDAEAEAAQLRSQGFYFLARQNDPNDPNSWFAYPADSVAIQNTFGQNAENIYNKPTPLFDSIVTIGGYAIAGAEFFGLKVGTLGYGWITEKSAWVAGALTGAGFGIISNASGKDPLNDWSLSSIIESSFHSLENDGEK